MKYLWFPEGFPGTDAGGSAANSLGTWHRASPGAMAHLKIRIVRSSPAFLTSSMRFCRYLLFNRNRCLACLELRRSTICRTSSR